MAALLRGHRLVQRDEVSDDKRDILTAAGSDAETAKLEINLTFK